MTREEAIKIFNTVLFFGKCDCPKEEIEECLKMAIKALEQEPTNTIDYRRAFKIACDLLNGDILYGVDTDKIYELMMKKDEVVSSSSYEEYILNHLQDLDQGQYANEPTTKNDLIDCEHTDCNNCVNHKYCDYEPTTKNDLGVDCISRAEVFQVLWNYEDIHHPSYDLIIKDIRALPSVTPQEPILEKINKMKSEIADSLEFWDYSPNNNPLARDMLETLTNFWGDVRGEEE